MRKFDTGNDGILFTKIKLIVIPIGNKAIYRNIEYIFIYREVRNSPNYLPINIFLIQFFNCY